MISNLYPFFQDMVTLDRFITTLNLDKIFLPVILNILKNQKKNLTFSIYQ